MKLKCAECECRVERGERVVHCVDANACCCTDVPKAPGAVGA